VQISVPLGNVIGEGSNKVFGTAVDVDGSGVVRVEVWKDGAWQVTSGTSSWMTEVMVPDGDDFSLKIKATDATGISSEVNHTFALDTTPPELNFDMETLLTGDDFNLLGTVIDADSRAVMVEVQLDDDGIWLPVVGPFQPDETGTQSWLYLWDLPQEDYTEHQLRARAVDVVGNETVTEWLSTIVDTQAPVVKVQVTLATGLLSDYDAGELERAPKPIAIGTVSDLGGLSTVFAHFQMPNGEEMISPAVLEGTTFNITPGFENPVLGEYMYTIEAADNAGNRSILGPFVFIASDKIVAPSALGADQDLTRVEVINKTNQAVSIVLSNEKANYILKVEASERRRFIIGRANYNRITYACGVSDTGFLNVTGQIRLVFTPCWGPAPNMGEPSIEKIHIPDSPKGNHWRYK
jgi:hypothetical protein